MRRDRRALGLPLRVPKANFGEMMTTRSSHRAPYCTSSGMEMGFRIINRS